jgi:hypothetical protein
MAKKAGLGRGLDALFADAVPVMEELTEAPEAKAKATEAPAKKGKKAAPKKSANAAEEAEDRVLYIDINDIMPNSAQPRKNFDEVKLNELAESIRTNGVISPLIVRESKTGYADQCYQGGGLDPESVCHDHYRDYNEQRLYAGSDEFPESRLHVHFLVKELSDGFRDHFRNNKADNEINNGF